MKKYDLTNGNITLQMIQLSLPLIMGNILQQLYNTIDALVIGRYAGQTEFAAIGIAGSVMNLFLFAIVGACTGISVIFSQQYGMKDMNGFRHEHFFSVDIRAYDFHSRESWRCFFASSHPSNHSDPFPAFPTRKNLPGNYIVRASRRIFI